MVRGGPVVGRPGNHRLPCFGFGGVKNIGDLVDVQVAVRREGVLIGNPRRFNGVIRETAAARQPLGRQGDSFEVGAVARFLVSDAASFMTRSIPPVDGGGVTTFNYGDASN